MPFDSSLGRTRKEIPSDVPSLPSSEWHTSNAYSKAEPKNTIHQVANILPSPI